MVSLRFTNFVFALMFILLDSAVYTNQEMEKIVVAAGNGIIMAGVSPLTTRKGIFNAVPPPPEGKRGKLGGRKMKRMILEKEEGKSTTEGETSKIKGLDIESTKKSEDPFKPANRVEKEKKLVASDVITDELVNLIRKDYGRPHPPKPPISNYKPLGRGNLIP